MLQETLKNSNFSVTIIDYDIVKEVNLTSSLFSINDIDELKVESLIKRYSIIKKIFKCKIENIPIKELLNYKIWLCCVDNIITRMNINSSFHKLKHKSILIDFGIEGYEFHIKHFYNFNKLLNNNLKKESCLYCIKELYKTQKQINFCSDFNLLEEIFTTKIIIPNSVSCISILISIFFKEYFLILFNEFIDLNLINKFEYNFICGNLYKGINYQKLWINKSNNCFYCQLKLN